MSAAVDLLDHAVKTGMVSRPLMTSVRAHEGYRGHVYKDTLGYDTVGVGCRMPLSEDESMLLAACRAADSRRELTGALGRAGVRWENLSEGLRDALTEMSYQLGVPKMMKFRKMLAAIAARQWDTAADEALDSTWARDQTPVRAEALAKVLRSQD